MSKALTSVQRRRILRQSVIRVYSFQSVGAYEASLKRGYWTGDADFVEDDFDRQHGIGWKFQYDWMRSQMGVRIPNYSGDYPVWAYLKRPNLRQMPVLMRPTVKLVADIPRSRILISDYDRWHSCLNYWYCADTEAEDTLLDNQHPKPHQPSRHNPLMLKTWERIFDLSDITCQEKLAWMGGQPNDLQACIDRIYPHEVVSVRSVTGRIGRNRPANLR